MVDLVLDNDNFVHLAAGLYLVGFLFRDQIMLRALVIAGDIVFILYYLFAPAEPLWGGIVWSAIFIGVNVVMIVQIVADRTHRSMPDEHVRLYSMFDAMTPGEFRRMVRTARWETAKAETRLTEENKPLERLYFVLEGDIAIDKSGKRIAIAPGIFIGEVAFLLSRPASATVIVAPGTRYVVWDTVPLRRLLIRAPSLSIALSSALNRDMAAKVARASG